MLKAIGQRISTIEQEFFVIIIMFVLFIGLTIVTGIFATNEDNPTEIEQKLNQVIQNQVHQAKEIKLIKTQLELE